MVYFGEGRRGEGVVSNTLQDDDVGAEPTPPKLGARAIRVQALSDVIDVLSAEAENVSGQHADGLDMAVELVERMKVQT